MVSRIIAFSFLFLAIIFVIHNLVLSKSSDDNLIALFYIRKDNLKNTMEGEIYPIAFYSKGKYTDASVGGEDAVPEKKARESVLNTMRTFNIISKGKTAGRFQVDSAAPGEFMCLKILTGRGKTTNAGQLNTIFNAIEHPDVSHSKSFENKKNIDYTLKWTLAATRISKKPAATVNLPEGDIKRNQADTLRIGKSLLEQYRSVVAGNEDKVVLDRFSSFDLDHDGKPEVSAKFKKQIKAKAKVSMGEKGWEEDSNDTVYLNLWLTYKTGTPETILSLISHEREGSWGKGHDLIGTLDVNGDGVEEVVMRSSSWEVVDFEIYEYRKGRLERVFIGAGFGC